MFPELSFSHLRNSTCDVKNLGQSNVYVHLNVLYSVNLKTQIADTFSFINLTCRGKLAGLPVRNPVFKTCHHYLLTIRCQACQLIFMSHKLANKLGIPGLTYFAEGLLWKWHKNR